MKHTVRKPTITVSFIPTNGRCMVRLLSGFDPLLAAFLDRWFATRRLRHGDGTVPAGRAVPHTRTWLCEIEAWPALQEALVRESYHLRGEAR